MTTYPAQIDTSQSLPTVVDNLTPVMGVTANRLRDAILAIEGQLGVKPSGIYTTVRNRLDTLESIIATIEGGGGGGNFVAGGDLSGTSTFQNVINIHGAAVPIAGSLITGNVLQVDGPTSLTYRSINLAGGVNFVSGLLPNTNQSPQNMVGDVNGTTAASTVVALRGKGVVATPPTAGQVLTFNGTNWAPASTAGTTVTLTGDVVGSGIGTISTTVDALQNHPVAATVPINGQVLTFNGTDWTPKNPAGSVTNAVSSTLLIGGHKIFDDLNNGSIPSQPGLMPVTVEVAAYTFDNAIYDPTVQGDPVNSGPSMWFSTGKFATRYDLNNQSIVNVGLTPDYSPQSGANVIDFATNTTVGGNIFAFDPIIGLLRVNTVWGQFSVEKTLGPADTKFTNLIVDAAKNNVYYNDSTNGQDILVFNPKSGQLFATDFNFTTVITATINTSTITNFQSWVPQKGRYIPGTGLLYLFAQDTTNHLIIVEVNVNVVQATTTYSVTRFLNTGNSINFGGREEINYSIAANALIYSDLGGGSGAIYKVSLSSFTIVQTLTGLAAAPGKIAINDTDNELAYIQTNLSNTIYQITNLTGTMAIGTSVNATQPTGFTNRPALNSITYDVNDDKYWMTDGYNCLVFVTLGGFTGSPSAVQIGAGVDWELPGGDLGGVFPDPTVVAIQGNPISSTPPSDRQVLTWVAGDGQWEPEPGFTPGTDLAGTSTSQTVIHITGAGGFIPIEATLIGDAANNMPLSYGINNVVMPSDANLTLSSTQYANPILRITSTPTLTTTRSIILPTISGAKFDVYNHTTGGQALIFIGTSGTGLTVPNGLKCTIYFDGTNYVVADILVGGDLSATSNIAQNVINIHGASVPIAGALTTGNVLQVSGISSLTYAPVNLAGGPNFVTGTLPAGNIPNLLGDVTGSITSNTVVKIQGRSIASTAPNDGYALVWVAIDNEWEPKGLAGDVTGKFTTNTVSAISGNSPIPITPPVLEWISTVSSPIITQITTSIGSGTSLTLQAQGATGATNNGGNLILASGTSGSATAGNIQYQIGNATNLTFTSGQLQWNANISNPTYVQAAQTSNLIANDLIIKSQDGYQVALSGTFNVTGGSPSVTSTVSNVVSGGNVIVFGSQGVAYTVMTVSGTSITLTTNYAAGNNSAITAILISSTAANRHAGNIILDIGIINDTTNSSYIKFRSENNVFGLIGPQFNSPSTGALYLNTPQGTITPSASNWVLSTSSGITNLNGPGAGGQLRFWINAVEVGSLDTTALTLFNNNITFGVSQTPLISQTTRTSDAVAEPLTISAQNAFATATSHITGGNLLLNSGLGATSNTPYAGGNIILNAPTGSNTANNGNIQFQIGGATQLSIYPFVAQLFNPKNAIVSGVVAIVNGSPTVTGTNTAFTKELLTGQIVYFNTQTSATSYIIQTIASDTSLTLTTNYSGTTSSAALLSIENTCVTTQGSPVVIGNNTTFTSQFSVGQSIQFSGGNGANPNYIIKSIQSDTNLTLNSNYRGASQATSIITPATTIYLKQDETIAQPGNNLVLSAGTPGPLSNISGTVSITNGSATVTGTGTAFTTQLQAGQSLGFNTQAFNGAGTTGVGTVYIVSSITNDTSLTLTLNYTGQTCTAAVINAVSGTMTATNASNTITGTGTLFTTQLVVGQSIQFSRQLGTSYTIASIAGATSLKLTANYTGTTTTGNLTGTVTVANGSPTVTGSGTAFTTQLFNGQSITFGGGTATGTFIVSSIASDTSLTLTTNYSNTGASGATVTALASMLANNVSGGDLVLQTGMGSVDGYGTVPVQGNVIVDLGPKSPALANQNFFQVVSDGLPVMQVGYSAGFGGIYLSGVSNLTPSASNFAMSTDGAMLELNAISSNIRFNVASTLAAQLAANTWTYDTISNVTFAVSLPPLINSTQQSSTNSIVNPFTIQAQNAFNTVLTGTFTTINSSPTVTATVSQAAALNPNDVIVFSNQNAQYIVSTVVTTTITLTTNFTGVGISGLTVTKVSTTLGGTFNVSNSSASVTASVSQSAILTTGTQIAFASQIGTYYTVASVSGTSITLTTNYNGTSNAATTGIKIINNDNGGNLILQSGAASANGTIGNRGAVQLQLGNSTSGTMIEASEIALNQRVVALAQDGLGVAFTLTGLMTVTGSSPTVTGSSTLFTTQLQNGQFIQFSTQPGTYYTVLSIATATSLTLTSNYTGTTTSNVTAKTTYLSQNGGDGIVYVGNVGTAPTDLPVAGITLYASGANTLNTTASNIQWPNFVPSPTITQLGLTTDLPAQDLLIQSQDGYEEVLAGTFSVFLNSPSVTSTVSNVVSPGVVMIFLGNPTTYTVMSVSGTSITLTTNYLGGTTAGVSGIALSTTAANRHSGSIILDIGTNVDNQNNSFVKFRAGSNDYFGYIGPRPSNPTYSALYLNTTLGTFTPSSSNYALSATGGATLLNSTSQLRFTINDILQSTLDTGAWTIYVNNITFLSSTLPVFSHQTRVADAATQTLTIQAQSAFPSAVTNTSGGTLLLEGGNSAADGYTGGQVKINSGLVYRTLTVTNASYTIDTNATASDLVILCNRAGAIAITLPTQVNGRTIYFKDISGAANTNNITITPASGNIDGAGSYVLNLAWAGVELITNGTNWFVIGEYNGTVI